jgi:hypothetical protein
MARSCPDPGIADGFRAVAADYFELAERAGAVGQQQQQIQPTEPEGNGA